MHRDWIERQTRTFAGGVLQLVGAGVQKEVPAWLVQAAQAEPLSGSRTPSRAERNRRRTRQRKQVKR